MIFPVAVCGNWGRNSIQRGYLYDASSALTCCSSCSSSTGPGVVACSSTTHASACHRSGRHRRSVRSHPHGVWLHYAPMGLETFAVFSDDCSNSQPRKLGRRSAIRVWHHSERAVLRRRSAAARSRAQQILWCHNERPPIRLDGKMCNISVEPMPSRISTPKCRAHRSPTSRGSASPAETQARRPNSSRAGSAAESMEAYSVGTPPKTVGR